MRYKKEEREDHEAERRPREAVLERGSSRSSRKVTEVAMMGIHYMDEILK